MGINNFLLTLENVLPYSCGQKRCFGGTLGYSICNFFKLKPFFEKEYITESDQKNEIDPSFPAVMLLVLSSYNLKSNTYC